MSYKNGKDVLPPELLKELQKYIQGEIIYIPREENARKAWGENSGIRLAIRERNHQIYQMYRKGMRIDDLIDLYHLSEDSIRKIIVKINSEAVV